MNCLVAAGRLAIGQAAYGEAERVSVEAVALAREHGGPHGWPLRRGGDGAARPGLRGHVHRRPGPGRRAHRAEPGRRRASQDRFILAQALFSLGWGVSNAGAYERARALATEALDLFAELGETGEHAEALFVLGTVAMYTGDYRGAVGIFEQSLAERRGRGGDEHTAARHLGPS